MYHFAARAHFPKNPLIDRSANADLWRRLREVFPSVAACVLMPNHIHLLARSGVTRDLAVVLRSWARRHRLGRIWSAVPKAERIPDLHHLKRQIRYVHLNPCRKGWVRDPLLWEWSTHRDLAGFVADPWIDRELLREVFRCSSARLGEVAHQYISADPSASVAGTHAPVHAPAAATDVRTVHRAASVATREVETHIALVVQVVERLRMKADPQALGVSLRTWQRVRRLTMNEEAIQATLRVLSEPRCNQKVILSL